jgi:hypothetical protein
MNFKIRLQCFKVTPFSFGDQLFLNVEQILPTKDTEDFATSSYCRGEVFINRGSKEENKEIFDYFYAMKDKILIY